MSVHVEDVLSTNRARYLPNSLFKTIIVGYFKAIFVVAAFLYPSCSCKLEGCKTCPWQEEQKLSMHKQGHVFNRGHLNIVVKLWNYFKVSGTYYWEDTKLSVAANTVIPFYITIKISLIPQKYEREWAAAFVLLVLITVTCPMNCPFTIVFSTEPSMLPYIQHLNNICHPRNTDPFPQQANPSLPAKALPTKSSVHSHTPFVFTPPTSPPAL